MVDGGTLAVVCGAYVHGSHMCPDCGTRNLGVSVGRHGEGGSELWVFHVQCRTCGSPEGRWEHVARLSSLAAAAWERTHVGSDLGDPAKLLTDDFMQFADKTFQTRSVTGEANPVTDVLETRKDEAPW